MRQRLSIGGALCVLGGFVFGVALGAPPADVSKAEFKVTVESNVKVPMRDGTRLAADLYKPEGPGPFPVMLQRTPYNKLGKSLVALAHYYAERGYAVVLQDTRGRFASEGDFRNYLDDGWGKRQDGYDTVEWAGTQPWSNGKVGTFGISYAGTIQYMTAVTRPPHLAAMFVGPAAADFYQEMRYAGGAFMGHAITWEVSNQAFTRKVGTEDEWLTLLQDIPKEEAMSLQSLISPTLMEWINNPVDNAFWWQTAVYKKFSEIDVPIYHHGGWFDRYSRGITKTFSGVSRQGHSEKARRSQKLIMGPWPHSDQSTRELAGVDYGAAAAEDINLLRLKWFDYWLKGADNGIMDEPAVKIFVMGENHWRNEKDWPPSNAAGTHYFLRAGKTGTPSYSLNDGTLSRQAPPADEKPDAYRYHPKEPLPTLGGDTRFGQDGPMDQQPVERKSLTYTTEAMTEDLEVTGVPQVTLYVSTTGLDSDFVAILTDVAPNGESRILTRSLMRAKYHKTFEKAELLKPGQVYQLNFELGPFSHVFKPGHRVRVSISSSSYPAWIPNPNTGRDFGQQGPIRIVTNTVYHDARQSSHLTLPVVPKGETRVSAAR